MIRVTGVTGPNVRISVSIWSLFLVICTISKAFLLSGHEIMSGQRNFDFSLANFSFFPSHNLLIPFGVKFIRKFEF